MNYSDKDLPLEEKSFKVETNGTTKMIPGLHRTWVDKVKRNFSRYIAHPVPVNGSFVMGEKEIWLELASFVIEDLEWLLQQRHHIFWSHMVYCEASKWLLITFLQEAPPYYLRSEFPNDKDMEEALAKIEHLVFLVFVRLSTEKESESNFIKNLGSLLYDNYIFTVPIFLDICLIYGISNRQLVAKMFDNVISAAPQYLKDIEEIVPHFIHVLSVVRDKFDNNEISLLNDTSMPKLLQMRDVILHLYDSAANIQIFLDIHWTSSKFFRTESFASEVSNFYSNIIPKIYNYIKKNDCDLFRTFYDKIDAIRLNLLSIVKSMFCGLVNDVLNDEERKEEYANEYLTKTTEILQERLFLSDFNRMYPIDTDLKLLTEHCPEIDTINLMYITEAIAPYNEPGEKAIPVSDVELESLITEVKDILPHLGDGFVESCIRFYNFNTERVVAAILEDTLPPDISKLDRNMRRVAAKEARVEKVENVEKKVSKNQEMINLLNDKTELKGIRDRISNLSVIPDNGDDYDDEYDDTYDDRDVSLRGADDADVERRPFVTPRILRAKEDSGESEGEEVVAEEQTTSQRKDCFVANPAEIRAKQEQRRIEKAKRDYVGRGKGRGQDKQVLMNRDYKDTHKSFMANHNRRKLASRKRNIPLVHS